MEFKTEKVTPGPGSVISDVSKIILLDTEPMILRDNGFLRTIIHVSGEGFVNHDYWGMGLTIGNPSISFRGQGILKNNQEEVPLEVIIVSSVTRG